MNWLANQQSRLPAVQVYFQNNHDSLVVRFNVNEPESCYRAEIQNDGDRSYEDSCVEIFIRALDNPSEYFNFEFTSLGFCLAAKGSSRFNRTPFDISFYSKIDRVSIPPKINGDSINWALNVTIPKTILGYSKNSHQKIEGNIYKCADLSKTPHYLTLFPITTDKPDFHRPEFFRPL